MVTIIYTNRLIFISHAKFCGAGAWQEWSASDVEYLMTSLLLQDLHVAAGDVVCTLTQAKSLTTIDPIRGSHRASLGPGQTLFKSKAELALLSLGCSPREEAGGRQSSSLLSWKVKLRGWSTGIVKDPFTDFSEPYTLANLVLGGVICTWWSHTDPHSSLLGYPKVTHFIIFVVVVVEVGVQGLCSALRSTGGRVTVTPLQLLQTPCNRWPLHAYTASRT